MSSPHPPNTPPLLCTLCRRDFMDCPKLLLEDFNDTRGAEVFNVGGSPENMNSICCYRWVGEGNGNDKPLRNDHV